MNLVDQAERLRDIVKQKNQQEIAAPTDVTSRIITVTSGKGGVGKSNITLNLALALTKHDKRVVIMDADFGLANIEVLFGLVPKYNLKHVFDGEKTIGEIITEGPMGVKLVSGGSGIRELANMDERQMGMVIEKFAYLDTISDIILVDTGAGMGNSVLNFVKASGETLIVTTPEPTSLTDSYAVVKAVYNEMGSRPLFKVIVNRADNEAEAEDVFGKISTVSKHFLNIDLENLGFIPYDANMLKAVKRQEPVFTLFPETEAARSIDRICLKLMGVQTAEVSGGIKSFLKKFAGFFTK